MWVKGTVPRLSSWCRHWDQKAKLLSFIGGEVDIAWWPVAAKPHFSHTTRVWLKCSWIIINIHCGITEEHGWSTVANQYHAGVRPHCRKLVEWRKVIAVSHAAWSCAKCMHSCLSGLGRAALRCSRLPSTLCAPCCSEMRERHRCKVPVVAPLNVCMQSRIMPAKLQES